MNNGQAEELLRNEGGNRQNWLQVELRVRGPRGPVKGSNTDGIGARVTVRTGSVVQHDYVRSGSSHCSQSMLRRHFGLGAARRADWVEVTWTTGRRQRSENVPANQCVVIEESRAGPRRLPGS